MNMTLRSKLAHRKLVLLPALSALAVLVWLFASGPILFRSQLLAAAEDRACPEDPGVGVPVFNPFRSRSAERVADAFLRAASHAVCLPDLNGRVCRFLSQHPLPPAESWRLVDRWTSAGDMLLEDRWGSAQHIVLVYRLYFQGLAKHKRNGCLLATVELHRDGGTWKVSGYGVEPAIQVGK